jgi:hypothetical protein
MKSTRLSLIGALALAGAAYAQVPATNDTSTTDGLFNTGMGTGALGGPTPVNLTGSDNTAVGFQALFSNTTGSFNTAAGFKALVANTTGSNNTGLGLHALWSNTTGNENTASGVNALLYNTSGYDNTASGVNALLSNTSGYDNTASGFQSLYSNTTGDYNTAAGYQALYSNNGYSNTASGYEALYSNTGSSNTATGVHALANSTTGSNNTGIGYHAGVNLTTGSNNIDIGSPGTAGDNNLIRLGVQGTQTATFIAGIYGHSLTGSEVVVTSSGELGVVSSSERFKTAIAPMGSNTEKLGQLRPVTFKLKADATGTRQYGLIAEEVAKVYPELVIRNEAGRIDGIRYDELAPMLLNEVQKQAAEIRALKVQAQAVGEMQKQLAEMHAALAKLQNRDELVAQR